jgi:arylsulfatase A-like enzyme
MAITHDLTSTTLSLAGVAVPADRIDGVDLMGYWTGQKTGDAHDWLAWSLGPKGGLGTKPTIANTERWSVRQGPWKLVRDGEKGASGLFDLSQDESETKNLEPAHPKKVAELTAIFEGWLTTTAPACGPIQRTDTRPGGDDRKLADLREHCRRLLEEKKPAP